MQALAGEADLYEVLGALIEAVSGDAYADFCSREVLPRFGMTAASVQRPGVAAPATVTGYRVAAGHVSPAPPAVAPYPAAGGMTADVGDLLALSEPSAAPPTPSYAPHLP